MWPSENTLWLLIGGLMPLLYVIFLAFRYGFSEAASLRFAGVFLIWMGYHLSAWIGFLNGETWDHYLMVEEFVDDGLLFSILCMVAYLVGFARYFPAGSGSNEDLAAQAASLPRIRLGFMVSVAVVSIVLFVIVVGGPEEVWESKAARGFGQFDDRDFFGKLMRITAIASVVVNVVLACVASLYVLQASRADRWSTIPIGGLMLMISSLRHIHWFSRGAGVAFVIFAFFAIRILRSRGLVLAVTSLAMAGFLGAVGLKYRNANNPGLGTFIDATYEWFAGTPVDDFHIDESDSILLVNPLSAIEAWTRKAEERAVDVPDKLKMAAYLVWNQHPLPSEFVPMKPIGMRLSDIMNTRDVDVDFTTPSMAEVYYVFGHWGCGVFLLVGLLFGRAEKTAAEHPNLINCVCLLLCFVAIPVGLHSWLRSFTRPILYGFVVRWLANRVPYLQSLMTVDEDAEAQSESRAEWRSSGTSLGPAAPARARSVRPQEIS